MTDGQWELACMHWDMCLWERSGTEGAVAGAQVKLLRTKFVEALGAEGRHLVDVNTIDGFQVAHNTSPSFPPLLYTAP